MRIRDRLIGIGEPVLPRYERIVFDKPLIAPQGQPLAAFVCSGHPLLDAPLGLVLERHRDLLRRGTVLVDERDAGTSPRVLFYLEHAVQDVSLTRSVARRTISKRMLYVEPDASGNARHLHYAPCLDYRPLRGDEPEVQAILDRPERAWITRELEQKALGHAVAHVVPEHLEEVRGRRLTWIDKARAAVKDRLTREIGCWDHRAEQIRLQGPAGKTGFRLNSQEVRRRADDLQGRLQKRMAELDLEAQVSALPPVVLGGLVVVPMGLVGAMAGRPLWTPATLVDTQAVAVRARAIPHPRPRIGRRKRGGRARGQARRPGRGRPGTRLPALYGLRAQEARTDALRYNALVQSWPEISRLAHESGTRRAEQTTLFGQD